MTSTTPTNAAKAETLADLLKQSAEMTAQISEHYRNIARLEAEQDELWARIREARALVERSDNGITQKQVDAFFARIIDSVATEYDVTHADVLGVGREGRVVMPRYIAMWILRTITGWSFAKVGRHFDRDQRTVMYADNQLTNWFENQKFVKDDAERLLELCRAFAPGRYGRA